MRNVRCDAHRLRHFTTLGCSVEVATRVCARAGLQIFEKKGLRRALSGSRGGAQGGRGGGRFEAGVRATRKGCAGPWSALDGGRRSDSRR